MNQLFTHKTQAVSARAIAVVTIVSMILSAFPAAFLFAASTGVTISDSAVSTPVDTQVNFVVSATSDDTTYTFGTYIALDDNGAGGDFYTGTVGGDCNAVTPDVDNEFSIDQNKGVCYANSTPGVYTIDVQLLDANGGNPIGANDSIEITVTCTDQKDAAGITNIQNTNTGDYFDTVNDALTDCDTSDGDIVKLFGDITISEQITISRPITFDGNNYEIDAAFAKPCPLCNDNNSAIGIINTSDVNVYDVTLDGTNGTDLHGLNVYQSTNVTVEGVTSENFRSGMVVNGSTVDASDFSTAGNIWHGINVAPGSGVTDPSILNISETSTHDDTPPVPHIYTDNIDAGPTIEVNDLDNQYDKFEGPNPGNSQITAAAYYLKTPIEPNPLVSECIDPTANLLANGSFEAPEVTKSRGWDLFGTTDWVTTAVNGGATTDLEFHRGWSDNMAVDGEQYVELDALESAKVTQTPAVLEGGVYELSWAFAPRHGLAEAENQLAVFVDGTQVATSGPQSGSAGLEPLDWTRSSHTFTASSDSVEVMFADAGLTSDKKGTYLDDARLCLVREPVEEPPEVCSYEGDVVSFTQGTKNNGNPVDANRGLVSAVENGKASYTNFFGKEGNDWQVNPLDFTSLGINGELVYEFSDKIAVDGPGDDIAIWEITGGNADQQSGEKVTVYGSEDGVTFSFLGQVTGDGSVDINGSGLDFVKFVKVVDQSNGIQGGNGDGYDLDAITIIDESCEDFVSVHTTKIVCEDESELPDYGPGGPNMTETTATDWVAQNPSCEIVDGWEFEWAPKGTSDPGDTLVGSAGGDWNTFTGSVTMPVPAINGANFFWMREVLEEDYIPFTHEVAKNNSLDYSAEMYCHTDVKNYDNFDRVDNPQAGGDYYCVAWNVPNPMCSVEAVSDTGTVVVESNQYAVEAWEHPAWTASIPGAAWIWETFKVENPDQDEIKTFSETFTADGIKSAKLEVAADNSYKVTINGNLVVDETDENNFKDFSQDEYDVTSFIVDGENVLEIEVKNKGVANSTPESNPGAVMYKLTVDAETQCELTTMVEEEPEPEAPYCGDNEKNQDWEQCDGGSDCTEYCTFANQCTALKLVKIDFEEAVESVSFNKEIYLGDAANTVPEGVWFNLEDVANGNVQQIAENNDGLALSNDGSGLTFAVWGGNTATGFDYVNATVHFKGVDLGAKNESNAVIGWPLEDSGSYIDVFDKNGDESIDMQWYLTTGGDAASVAYTMGEEYDCPECKAEVEARVVIRDEDGSEVATNGLGNLTSQVILGDGTTVPFGEWFKISEAPAVDESAEWIDDAETVTSFTDPETLEGLFVSREGNGQVKVALYGFHNPGGDTNYESLRATIEFNDAEVASAQQIPGDYKLENHSETDQVNSNDNFDEFEVNTTSVDFDFWVDTKADGITITLDSETIATCDDDTDPEEDLYLIDGYKYEQGDDYIGFVDGWEIELHDESGLVAATTTDENGYYYFWAPAGDYDVKEVMQDGWMQIGVQDGYDYIYPQGEPHYCSFTVPYEETGPVFNSISVRLLDVEYNYSEFRCDFYNAKERLNRIDGYKFEVDGDASTPGVGWTIYASSSDTVLSTTTDSTGYYYFDVPAGEWEVYEEDRTDWTLVEVDQFGLLLSENEEVMPTSCYFWIEGYGYYPLVSAEVELTNQVSAQRVTGDRLQQIGFRCDFYNEFTGDDSEPDNTPRRNSSNSSGTRLPQATPQPLVAGATDSVTQCPFLEDYMQIGIENDSMEVMKLQLFLNIFRDLFGGTENPVTGVFDETTDANVKRFQEQYRSEVLDPWFERGIVPHNRPTGFVYKTTLWKINDIVCPEYAVLPDYEGEDLSTNVDLSRD